MENTDSATDLDTIWSEVGASVKGFVRRRISDPHQADDVVAEVMLRIHQKLATLDGRERVTAWVFRITRNAITDYYRRTARRREVLGAEIEPGADSGADDWLDDRQAALSELAACVRPLVGALPSDYRRALELTDIEGFTQAEAARIEGISLSGMKSRVQRGRARLRQLLAACCHLEQDVRGRVQGCESRSAGGACG